MPVAVSYPGVYVEEIPSGVRTITGVATSITAFIGKALRGPVNQAVTITSFADFERIFGGLDRNMTLGYAVRDFFVNGGSQAIIVRLYKTPASSAAKAVIFTPIISNTESNSSTVRATRIKEDKKVRKDGS